MDKKHCAGCHDNVYNGQLANGCWSLKTARIVTRYRTGTWTMPLSPGAFTEVRVPNCYRQPGQHFTDKPHPEAVDVVRLSVVS